MIRLRSCLLAGILALAAGLSSQAAVFQARPSAQTSPPAASAPPETPGNTAQTPAATSAPAERKESRGYALSPEKYRKAVEYSRAQYMLYFIDFVYGLLVLFLVLRMGIGARFRDWAERVTDGRFRQALVFVPSLVLTLAVLGLPTSIYGHSLSLRYEQSIQRWGSWLWDWTKGQMISVVVLTLLVWILFAVIRRSPRRWWLYFWMAALPILVALFFITPWVIEPLFNKFEPLDAKHPELVAAIGKVVQRSGLSIPRDRMFLMQASAKTNAINAYVTGFGASKRVVVWDTTIQKTSTPETLFVFGHEMGHYVLGHVRDGILFAAALLFVIFYLSFRALHGVLGRWGSAWGIRNEADWAALPVMLLLLSTMSFFASPVFAGFGRSQEHNADIYGLEVIHGIVPNSADVASHAFQVLGEVDLADPNPPAFITFWLYNHPPLADRLVFARTYDPWSKGEPPKYVK